MEINELVSRAKALQERFAERDVRMQNMRLVRQGKAAQAFPEMFPPEWPQPVIANMMEVASKSMAEQVGVMPTVTATGDSSLDDRKRDKAQKRTQIANAYPAHSKLGTKLPGYADWLGTYGFVALRVEPDHDSKMPAIIADDPFSSYPEWDKFGRLTAYAKKYNRRADQLAAQFPELSHLILKKNTFSQPEPSAILTVWRFTTKDGTWLFTPERDLVLASEPNKLSRINVVVARLSSIDEDLRGNYDDALFVYAARSYMALLRMQATQAAVEAPIVVPLDVDDFPVGANAILRTKEPQGIHRVPLDIPADLFREDATLAAEARMSARFSEVQQGQSDASIVTGQGVKALMSGFDATVKVAQAIMAEAVADVISLCFEMDEVLWGKVKKTAHTVINGTPADVDYTPEKDIKGDWNVEAIHGMMSGLDPSRALVFGLQARGDKLISRSFLRKHLPVSMNVVDEERAVDIEDLRDTLKIATQQLASSIGQQIAQGQDPEKTIKGLALIIQERKAGVPIEDAIYKAFDPDPTGPGEQPGAPEPGEATPGQAPGQPPPAGGQMSGQAGPPAMQQLLAGLTGNGQASMAVRSQQSRPM